MFSKLYLNLQVILMLSILGLIVTKFGFSTQKDQLCTQNTTSENITDQIFVKLKNEIDERLELDNITRQPKSELEQAISTLVLKYKITQINCPFTVRDENLQHTYLFKFQNESIDEFLLELSKLNQVEYAEKIPVYHTGYTPNDPDLAGVPQWNLNTINAEGAWDVAQSCSNSKIAIVDDAVLTTHQDLAANIWVNPNEIINGLDDDGNGYVDDINGWDAADNDNDPRPTGIPSSFSFSHGTHCAGIASASTDDGIGIAGMGFSTKIVAVKCASNGSGSLPFAYQGVDYAIAADVDVISMSWGGSGFSMTYQNLMAAAHNLGITLVAAAGNNNSSQLYYPASYDHVISVAATNITDAKASFSNFGAAIDIAAPGRDIWSTVATTNNSYENMSGTSMAAPLVSGVAGLMKCFNPDLTPDDLEFCIKSTAVNIDVQNPNYIGQLGAGRIDAYQAMLCLGGPPIANFEVDINSVCAGASIQFTDKSYRVPTSWEWTFSGGVPATSNMQNPLVTYPANGLYNVTLIVSNSFGSDTLVRQNYIEIAPPTAVISGNSSINVGDNAFIQFDFTGIGPWDMTYTDGTSNFNVTGINTSPYLVTVSPIVTTIYTLVDVTSSQCVGMVSGSALVTVYNACGATVNFQTIFGGDFEDTPKDIEATPDCGFVITGSTFSFGEGSYDGFLTKLDLNGNQLWFKTYGDGVSNSLTDVLVLSDGYLLTGGSYGSNLGGHFLVIRTDLNGQEVWTRRYRNTTFNDGFHAIEANDGNFVIAGRAWQHYNQSTQTILKLDRSTGNLIWNRIYGNTDYLDGRAEKILHTADGGFIVSGSSRYYSGNGFWDASLLKLDVNGDFEWSYDYGLPNKSETGLDVEITADGGYILSGSSYDSGAGEDDVIVIRTDVNGILLWAKNYGGFEKDYASEIETTCDGGYMIFGKTLSFGEGLYDNYYLKIDAQGNLLWSKTLGGSADEIDCGLVRTGDCGFVTVAGTQSYGEGDNDIWVTKMGETGPFECYFTEPNTIVTNVVLNTTAATGNYRNDVTANNFSVIEANHTPIIVPEVCDACGKTEADFDYIINHFTTHFLDYSTSGESYFWDFGDGDSDTLRNPVHAFPGVGTYPIALTVSNECNTDTIIKNILITGVDTCKYVLQPGPLRGKDSRVWSRPDAVNLNGGTITQLNPLFWTWGGVPGAMRNLIEFDFSNVCDTANVLRSNLSLFYPIEVYPSCVWGNCHGVNNGTNAGWLRNLEQPWTEYGVTWNNQPTTTTTNQVILPAKPDGSDSDLLDLEVSALIQDQIQGDNFGFQIRVQSETTYRQQRYCSSDYPNPNRRPMLKIDFNPIFANTQNTDHYICPEDSVQLDIAGYYSGTQTSGPSNAIRYLWRPENGLSCTDCPDPMASPSETTTYEASVFNCSSCADLLKITVHVSKVDIDIDQAVLCGSESAQLTANVLEAAGATYSWSPTIGLSDPTIPNPIASPPGQTMYTVTAIDSNGCTTMDSVLVFLAPEPVLPELPDTSLCQGTGIIPIELAPLNIPPISDYQYEWAPTNGLSDIFNPNPLVNVDLSIPANYYYMLTVTNADGCILVDTIEVTINDTLMTDEIISICPGDSTIIFGNYETLSGNYSQTFSSVASCDSVHTITLIINPTTTIMTTPSDATCNTCNDGSVVATPSGGTPAYTYLWDDSMSQTTPIATGLLSGTYTVTITDTNGCLSTASVLIAAPLNLSLTATLDAPVQCFGENTGVATATPSDGIAPYNFVWDNGATTATATNLSGGFHQVTISDSSGQIATASVLVLELLELNANALENSPVTCFGNSDGVATSMITGGTFPYTYLWSNGSTAANPANLFAGTHTLSITDLNGCTASANVTITEPPPFTGNTSVNSIVSCNGASDGSATANGSGGTTDYSYIWDNGETTSIAVSLTAGAHTVTITDNNGCFVVYQVSVNSPLPISYVVDTVSDVSCNGGNDGSATVMGVGGIGSYQYNWNTSPPQNASTATGLSAGTYSITIVDSNGCIMDTPATVTIVESISLLVNLNSVDVTCWGEANGSISADVSGGTSPYQYHWNNGQTNSEVTGLDQGNYTVTVTDAEGCLTIETITVIQPAPIQPFSSSLNTICFGDENGSLQIDSVDGSSPPFLYSMDGNFFQPAGLFGGLGSGNYMVYVMDSNGCIVTRQVYVDGPNEIQVEVQAEFTTVVLGDSTQIESTVNTLDTLSYSWTPTDYLSCFDCPNPVSKPFETTTYNIVVANDDGCLAETAITIEVDRSHDVFIPNGFTPNNDGVNDFASIFTNQSISGVNTFKIFDRWGELVYEANDIVPNDVTKGWDGTFRGKPLGQGVFVYFAEVEFVDGEVILYKGDITLIR